MPLPRWPRGLKLLTLTLALATPSVETAARPRATAPDAIRAVAPKPVLPLAGALAHEGSAHFEVARGTYAGDIQVVVSRFRFDPTSWKSVPEGSAWTRIPFTGAPIPLAPLGLADRTDTRLWWAVVWTDARTGVLRASEAQPFTLVPRFANRVATNGGLLPTATGRVPAPPRTASPLLAPRPAIELSAGYSLVPGEALPLLPSATRREGEAAPGDGAAPQAWVVQFADDSPDSARARIERSGGRLVWPIAGNAYVVRADEESRLALERAGGEPWLAPYEAAYKVSLAFADTLNGQVGMTALLFDDADGAATLAALRALGAARVESHRGRFNHLVRFELDHARVLEAAALSGIAWVEPTPEYLPSNDLSQWVLQSGVQDSLPVTAHGLRGQGQLVMTSDSGLRTNHEMFYDSTLAIDTWGDYPAHRKIVAYKPGSSSPVIAFGDVVAFDYHGTHTGGTVAGDPTPFSSARWSGLAREARLYFMDIGGASGGGLALPADLNDLYEPSYIGNAAGPVRISSNSWGGFSQASYTLSSMQTDQFVWNHPDYLVAFSSGNTGTFGAVNSPGTSKNVITVGATGNGTLQNRLAPFSSRGPVRDGRRKPDLMAPGEGVTSSYGATRYTYATYNGTSMSTPGVAGAMALVRQYLTEGWYPTGAPVAANALAPSAALMRAMAMVASRNDITGFRAPDNTIGYGRLTIDDVLYFPGDSLRTLLVDAGDGLSDQQFVEYQVHVTDPGQPLKIGLAWTDAPGSPASQVSLVNDLDLYVSHAGVTYRGNAMLNNTSVPGGPRDSLNVQELVRLPQPEAGLYTVRVEARRIQYGPQPLALCVTGGVGGPAGAVALDRFEYSLSDTLEIEVIDTDANGQVTAHVFSGTEPGLETVTLTGGNGVYRGSIPLSPGLVQSGDGQLAVTSGDQVTVTYTGAAAAPPLVATARIHVQAPLIVNVHATALSGTHAVVTWVTDLAGTSRVRFGTGGVTTTTVDSGGFVSSHAVLLTGLSPGTTYHYDVESATVRGEVTCDSLDGAHRSFTTRSAGTLALLMDDPDPAVLATWNNAFAALGWEVDVHPAASNEPPLVGNSSAGLRSYQAVMWQLDPDKYPPISDAQRAAIDSLMEGGTRLLVTGHDIGFGLSDAGAPSYSQERELWLERSLKSRYYVDNIWADTLAGVVGSPVSGAFADSLPYAYWLYADSGDNFGPAPGTDGVWSPDWTENFLKSRHMGMHWESNGPRGVPGNGVWGGQPTRLVGMFYEWRAMQGASTEHLEKRTAILHDAVAWLVGHRPPQVRIVTPAPGDQVVTDLLPVWYSIGLDAGRQVASRAMDYSLDGGETWTPAPVVVWADSMCALDLAAGPGGALLNSTRVKLRLRVTDDGTPSLRATAVMPGTFSFARPYGDKRGPALVAGSASSSSLPIRRNVAATLIATFSDAETGSGRVAGAEYSVGEAAAPAGAGTPMSGTFGFGTVQVSAVLATEAVESGTLTFWLRGRDTAGNWGTASALSVPASGSSTVGVGNEVAVDFLASPMPNPFRGRATVRFGLAREGDVQLELFDVSGRSVRTLASGKHAPGTHVSVWDGRDQQGHDVKAGVYFVRLQLPGRTFHSRVVSLR